VEIENLLRECGLTVTRFAVRKVMTKRKARKKRK
jgi:hypothetical protein